MDTPVELSVDKRSEAFKSNQNLADEIITIHHTISELLFDDLGQKDAKHEKAVDVQQWEDFVQDILLPEVNDSQWSCLVATLAAVTDEGLPQVEAILEEARRSVTHPYLRVIDRKTVIADLENIRNRVVKDAKVKYAHKARKEKDSVGIRSTKNVKPGTKEVPQQNPRLLRARALLEYAAYLLMKENPAAGIPPVLCAYAVKLAILELRDRDIYERRVALYVQRAKEKQLMYEAMHPTLEDAMANAGPATLSRLSSRPFDSAVEGNGDVAKLSSKGASKNKDSKEAKSSDRHSNKSRERSVGRQDATTSKKSGHSKLHSLPDTVEKKKSSSKAEVEIEKRESPADCPEMYIILAGFEDHLLELSFLQDVGVNLELILRIIQLHATQSASRVASTMSKHSRRTGSKATTTRIPREEPHRSRLGAKSVSKSRQGSKTRDTSKSGVNSGLRVERPFWKNLKGMVGRDQTNGPRLQQLLQCDVRLSPAMNAAGALDTVCEAMFNFLYDARFPYDDYCSHLHVVSVPSVKRSDMRPRHVTVFRDMSRMVPPESSSIAYMLHCMLEQVVENLMVPINLGTLDTCGLPQCGLSYEIELLDNMPPVPSRLEREHLLWQHPLPGTELGGCPIIQHGDTESLRTYHLKINEKINFEKILMRMLRGTAVPVLWRLFPRRNGEARLRQQFHVHRLWTKVEDKRVTIDTVRNFLHVMVLDTMLAASLGEGYRFRSYAKETLRGLTWKPDSGSVLIREAFGPGHYLERKQRQFPPEDQKTRGLFRDSGSGSMSSADEKKRRTKKSKKQKSQRKAAPKSVSGTDEAKEEKPLTEGNKDKVLSPKITPLTSKKTLTSRSKSSKIKKKLAAGREKDKKGALKKGTPKKTIGAAGGKGGMKAAKSPPVEPDEPKKNKSKSKSIAVPAAETKTENETEETKMKENNAVTRKTKEASEKRKKAKDDTDRVLLVGVADALSKLKKDDTSPGDRSPSRQETRRRGFKIADAECATRQSQMMMLRLLERSQDIVNLFRVQSATVIPCLYGELGAVEDLTRRVLLQELFAMLDDFTCVDYHYCAPTDSLLLHCYHDGDARGLAKRSWLSTLPTHVGLRDFRQYVLEQDDAVRSWTDRCFRRRVRLALRRAAREAQRMEEYAQTVEIVRRRRMEQVLEREIIRLGEEHMLKQHHWAFSSQSMEFSGESFNWDDAHSFAFACISERELLDSKRKPTCQTVTTYHVGPFEVCGATTRDSTVDSTAGELTSTKADHSFSSKDSAFKESASRDSKATHRGEKSGSGRDAHQVAVSLLKMTLDNAAWDAQMEALPVLRSRRYRPPITPADMAHGEKRARFVAFDVGPRRIQESGSETIYRGTDGVQLRVLRSHWLRQAPFVRVNLLLNGNTVVMRRPQGPSGPLPMGVFHVQTAAGAIVAFSSRHRSLATQKGGGKSRSQMSVNKSGKSKDDLRSESRSRKTQKSRDGSTKSRSLKKESKKKSSKERHSKKSSVKNKSLPNEDSERFSSGGEDTSHVRHGPLQGYDVSLSWPSGLCLKLIANGIEETPVHVRQYYVTRGPLTERTKDERMRDVLPTGEVAVWNTDHTVTLMRPDSSVWWLKAWELVPSTRSDSEDFDDSSSSGSRSSGNKKKSSQKKSKKSSNTSRHSSRKDKKKSSKGKSTSEDESGSPEPRNKKHSKRSKGDPHSSEGKKGAKRNKRKKKGASAADTKEVKKKHKGGKRSKKMSGKEDSPEKKSPETDEQDTKKEKKKSSTRNPSEKTSSEGSRSTTSSQRRDRRSKKSKKSDHKLPRRPSRVQSQRLQMQPVDFDVTTFEGRRFVVRDGKVEHEMPPLKVRSAVDPRSGEVYQQREDGTRVVLNEDGNLTVMFGDGTRISVTNVVDRPVRVEPLEQVSEAPARQDRSSDRTVEPIKEALGETKTKGNEEKAEKLEKAKLSVTSPSTKGAESDYMELKISSSKRKKKGLKPSKSNRKIVGGQSEGKIKKGKKGGAKKLHEAKSDPGLDLQDGDKKHVAGVPSDVTVWKATVDKTHSAVGLEGGERRRHSHEKAAGDTGDWWRSHDESSHRKRSHPHERSDMGMLLRKDSPRRSSMYQEGSARRSASTRLSFAAVDAAVMSLESNSLFMTETRMRYVSLRSVIVVEHPCYATVKYNSQPFKLTTYHPQGMVMRTDAQFCHTLRLDSRCTMFMGSSRMRINVAGEGSGNSTVLHVFPGLEVEHPMPSPSPTEHSSDKPTTPQSKYSPIINEAASYPIGSSPSVGYAVFRPHHPSAIGGLYKPVASEEFFRWRTLSGTRITNTSIDNILTVRLSSAQKQDQRDNQVEQDEEVGGLKPKSGTRLRRPSELPQTEEPPLAPSFIVLQASTGAWIRVDALGRVTYLQSDISTSYASRRKRSDKGSRRRRATGGSDGIGPNSGDDSTVTGGDSTITSGLMHDGSNTTPLSGKVSGSGTSGATMRSEEDTAGEKDRGTMAVATPEVQPNSKHHRFFEVRRDLSGREFLHTMDVTAFLQATSVSEGVEQTATPLPHDSSLLQFNVLQPSPLTQSERWLMPYKRGPNVRPRYLTRGDLRWQRRPGGDWFLPAGAAARRLVLARAYARARVHTRSEDSYGSFVAAGLQNLQPRFSLVTPTGRVPLAPAPLNLKKSLIGNARPRVASDSSLRRRRRRAPPSETIEMHYQELERDLDGLRVKEESEEQHLERMWQQVKHRKQKLELDVEMGLAWIEDAEVRASEVKRWVVVQRAMEERARKYHHQVTAWRKNREEARIRRINSLHEMRAADEQMRALRRLVARTQRMAEREMVAAAMAPIATPLHPPALVLRSFSSLEAHDGHVGKALQTALSEYCNVPTDLDLEYTGRPVYFDPPCDKQILASEQAYQEMEAAAYKWATSLITTSGASVPTSVPSFPAAITATATGATTVKAHAAVGTATTMAPPTRDSCCRLPTCPANVSYLRRYGVPRYRNKWKSFRKDLESKRPFQITDFEEELIPTSQNIHKIHKDKAKYVPPPKFDKTAELADIEQPKKFYSLNFNTVKKAVKTVPMEVLHLEKDLPLYYSSKTPIVHHIHEPEPAKRAIELGKLPRYLDCGADYDSDTAEKLTLQWVERVCPELKSTVATRKKYHSGQGREVKNVGNIGCVIRGGVVAGGTGRWGGEEGGRIGGSGRGDDQKGLTQYKGSVGEGEAITHKSRPRQRQPRPQWKKY